MRTRTKTILAASAIGIGLLAAPALDAHDSGASQGSGPGMMSQDGMMGMMGGMMSGMRSMMGMGDDMAGMMAQCQEMMQAMGDHDHGAARPNEQWRERAPNPEERS
jgi:hypothetical protein